jgi:hypothetical protein
MQAYASSAHDGCPWRRKAICTEGVYTRTCQRPQPRH